MNWSTLLIDAGLSERETEAVKEPLLAKNIFLMRKESLSLRGMRRSIFFFRSGPPTRCSDFAWFYIQVHVF